MTAKLTPEQRLARKRQRKAAEARAHAEREAAKRRAAGIEPHRSPEEQRRRAWAAVTEAKRRVPPFTDPRWERSHEEAMAEMRARGEQAA